MTVLLTLNSMQVHTHVQTYTQHTHNNTEYTICPHTELCIDKVLLQISNLNSFRRTNTHKLYLAQGTKGVIQP